MDKANEIISDFGKSLSAILVPIIIAIGVVEVIIQLIKNKFNNKKKRRK